MLKSYTVEANQLPTRIYNLKLK